MKKESNKSVLFSWIVSNILILAVPLAVSLVIFANSLAIYKSALDESNAEALKQLQHSLDRYLEEVLKVCIQIETNEPLGELIYASSLGDVTKSFDTVKRVLDLNRDLNGYSFSSGLVKGIMIAFRKANIVWYDYSIFDRNEFVKQRFPSTPAWDGAFLNVANHEFRELPHAEFGGKKTIALVHSIPELSSDPLANIIIYIDSTKFLEAAEITKRWDDAIVEIVDRTGQALYSTGTPTEAFPVSTLNALEENQGYTDVTIDGRSVVLSYVKSTLTDWTYLLAVPKTVYTSKFTAMRNLLVVGLALCVFLGSFAILIMVRRNYQPLKKILELLGPQRDGEKRRGNEFDLLQQSLYRLKSQDDAVQANFLRNLITGRNLDMKKILDKADALGIRFQKGDFLVILAYYDPDSPFFSRSEPKEAVDWFSFHRNVGNVVRDAFGPAYRIWQTEYAEMSVFLVNYPFGDGVWESDMLKILTGLQRALGTELLTVSFAVGAPHSHITDVPSAFQEALDAMEHRLITAENKPLFYAEVFQEPPHGFSYAYTFEMERVLANLLGSDDTEQAWNAVRDLLDGLAREQVDIELARCLLYDLIGTVMKTLVVYDIEIGKSAQERVQSVMAFRSLPELKERLKGLLDWVGDQVRKSRGERTENQLVGRLSDEIKNRYFDPNLNVSTLAAKVGMNPKYVSALYKTHIGESMIDTIHKTRIGKARELLQDPDLNIAEIAVKIGYNGSNALIRAFKYYEGITPGTYKKTVR